MDHSTLERGAALLPGGGNQASSAGAYLKETPPPAMESNG